MLQLESKPQSLTHSLIAHCHSPRCHSLSLSRSLTVAIAVAVRPFVRSFVVVDRSSAKFFKVIKVIKVIGSQHSDVVEERVGALACWRRAYHPSFLPSYSLSLSLSFSLPPSLSFYHSLHGDGDLHCGIAADAVARRRIGVRAMWVDDADLNVGESTKWGRRRSRLIAREKQDQHSSLYCCTFQPCLVSQRM